MRRFSPGFYAETKSCERRASASAKQPPADAVRLGEHAGIGVRVREPRLEAHQLVAAKGVYPDALSRAAFGQRRVQSRLSWPQALHRDDHVAGGDARLLRRAAFEHVRDGSV